MHKRLHLDFEIAAPFHLAGQPLRSLFVDRGASLKVLNDELQERLKRATDGVQEASLRVTLSCVSVDFHQRQGADSPLTPPVILSQVRLDHDAWGVLARKAQLNEFLYDALYGPQGNLIPALRAQINRMTNHYEHDACGTEWTDDHSCACDDECPGCGASIEPTRSDVHEELMEIPDTPSIFGLASVLGFEPCEEGISSEAAPRESMRY